MKVVFNRQTAAFNSKKMKKKGFVYEVGKKNEEVVVIEMFRFLKSVFDRFLGLCKLGAM